MLDNQQQSPIPNTTSTNSQLPKVSMKHVLLICFVFPVFFYPLSMLLASSMRTPEVGYELVSTIVQIIIWAYPLVLLPIAWGLSRYHDRHPEKGLKPIWYALGIEFLLVVAFGIYMVV